jgi:hypothetical protein
VIDASGLFLGRLDRIGSRRDTPRLMAIIQAGKISPQAQANARGLLRIRRRHTEFDMLILARKDEPDSDKEDVHHRQSHLRAWRTGG